MDIKLPSRKHVLLIFIPLVLSAFTHIWNPIGFPHIDQDEGHYMRRAMQVLDGLGPQESKSTYFYPYDHPYFGQIFLASLLKIVGYPDSLSPKVGDVHSIEMLYLVPRVLMGLLAVADTFLIYKIAEIRYGRNVAFLAAVFFAVMPLSWVLRRVLLESIQLPFLLTSILFALYVRNPTTDYKENNTVGTGNNNLNLLTVALSGIFLGLAIFTKIPAFVFIPLIFCIIYKNKINNVNFNKFKKVKMLGLWLAPVVLIPLIWPANAFVSGHFSDWMDGVLWQVDRTSRSLANSMEHIFKMDPVLILLFFFGLTYARIKRDYFIALWILPYLGILFFVDWVYFFHFIAILPAFCITPAVLVGDLLKKVPKIKLQRPLILSAVSLIIIFSLINTTILITSNINSTYFELVSYVNQILPNHNDNDKDDVSVIGPNGSWGFIWLIKHIFNKDFDFKWFEINRDYINGPLKNEKFILISDREVRHAVFEMGGDRPHIIQIKTLYNNSIPLEVYNNNTLTRYEFDKYPYNNILDDYYKLGNSVKMRGMDWTRYIEIREDYSIK